MNTGVKRSNEELVKMYQCSGNENYLQELITQNVGLMKSWAMNYAKTLPQWEVEDLISEAYFPLLNAVRRMAVVSFLHFSEFMYHSITTEFINRLPDKRGLQAQLQRVLRYWQR